MDTLDIMTLPLAVEGEPLGGGPKIATSGDDVKYVPWDGPDSAYIPGRHQSQAPPGAHPGMAE